MAESKFNKRLRDRMEKDHGFKFYRIESHSTSPGIPDDFFVHRAGSTGWLELKQEKVMPRRVAYRPAQPFWLTAYKRAGGRCWTAVHVVAGDLLLLLSGEWSITAEKDLGAVRVLFTFRLRESEEWERLAGVLRG